MRSISIHALREEGDPPYRPPALIALNFYPRPPRGGRQKILPLLKANADISIHALREEGDSLRETFDLWLKISIHALREEGDVLVGRASALRIPISIHALREEGDGFNQNVLRLHEGFLSTPSARRATEWTG